MVTLTATKLLVVIKLWSLKLLILSIKGHFIKD